MDDLIQPAAADKRLIYHQGRWFSQSQVMMQAQALAERLPRHRYVINLCHDRYHFLLLFCATLLRDQINLLPANRQPATVIDVAGRYADSVVISDRNEDLPIKSLLLSDLLDEQPISRIATPQPESIAAIAFTSGSTGQPCAHIKHWRTLSGTAQRLARRFVAGASQPNIVATVPSQHMYGLEMTVMMALQGGAALSSEHPFFPQDIAAALQVLAEPRMLVTTPVHLRALLKAGVTMPAIDLVVSATAPLSAETAAMVTERWQTTVAEIYGCTEAGSLATRITTSNPAWELLDDMYLEQQGDDFLVSGTHLPEPARLSDILTLSDDGRFELIGRHSDMINVGGKRASLASLTQSLLSIDGVDDAAVFMPDSSDPQVRPAALIVSSIPLDQVQHALSRLIDPVFLPRPMRKVTELPRNETGKLQIDALKALL